MLIVLFWCFVCRCGVAGIEFKTAVGVEFKTVVHLNARCFVAGGLAVMLAAIITSNLFGFILPDRHARLFSWWLSPVITPLEVHEQTSVALITCLNEVWSRGRVIIGFSSILRVVGRISQAWLTRLPSWQLFTLEFCVQLTAKYIVYCVFASSDLM
jgi:hypothetical protein